MMSTAYIFIRPIYALDVKKRRNNRFSLFKYADYGHYICSGGFCGLWRT